MLKIGVLKAAERCQSSGDNVADEVAGIMRDALEKAEQGRPNGRWALRARKMSEMTMPPMRWARPSVIPGYDAIETTTNFARSRPISKLHG